MASGQHFFGVPGESGLDDRWNDAEGASAFLLGPASPDSFRGSCSLRGMSVILVILAIKVLIALCGFSCHLIRSPKVWLVLDFLQHLMHWFLEYSVDSLCIGCLRLPYEISHRAIAVISV